MDVDHFRWCAAASLLLCDVHDAGDLVPRQQCGVISSFAVAQIEVVGDSA